MPEVLEKGYNVRSPGNFKQVLPGTPNFSSYEILVTETSLFLVFQLSICKIRVVVL